MEIIDGAERELSIMMACFGPDKYILSGIKRAMHRGVRARILIPKTANFNDDLNRLTVSELNRFSGSPDGGSGVRLGIYMTEKMMHAKLLVIGWAGAGGLLQIATAVCNMLFPEIKGTVTALVMIASSLCNYTILTAAAGMTPSGVMTMNIVLTVIGVLLGIFVNKNYSKMLEAAEHSK